MDATIRQMLDGYKMGVDAQAGMISDKSLVEPIREILAEMEALGDEPGMDIMKFQEKTQSSGLMARYGEEMGKLAVAMTAGLEQKMEQIDQVAADAKPVDLNTIDITDLSIILKPHQQVYNMTVKDSNLPHQKAAYEAFFALAEECATIPEFNRRAQAEGHYAHLGISSTWDANLNTFGLEVTHEQPDMLTYAIDAIEATGDYPFPESIVYVLNKLAYLNSRKQVVRQSHFSIYNSYAGEMGGYILDHSEPQRQRIVKLLNFHREMLGLDIDETDYNPYIRQLLRKGDEALGDKHGPDFLGLIPFARAMWYMDARLSPEDKKQFKSFEEVPPPPPIPWPYRTGPVGGVELLAMKPPFAIDFDKPYPLKLKLTNHSAETRQLDTAKGARMWVFDESGLIVKQKLAIDIPASLAAGEEWIGEVDLYKNGLPKVEVLHLAAFDVGVVGEHTCDLAEKYSNVSEMTPFTMPNYFLTPFEGGTATEPGFVMPHRPIPAYPFPKPVEAA
jgi:hypothetical protein